MPPRNCDAAGILNADFLEIDGLRAVCDTERNQIHWIEDLDSIFDKRIPTEFLVEPELPAKAIACLTGESESGKTSQTFLVEPSPPVYYFTTNVRNANIAASSAVVASPLVPTCPESGVWTRMRPNVSNGGYFVPRCSTLLSTSLCARFSDKSNSQAGHRTRSPVDDLPYGT